MVKAVGVAASSVVKIWHEHGLTPHLLAMPLAKQQDLRRQGAAVPNTPIWQPGRGAMRLAALAIGRTETALGAFYGRLSARVGKAKAVMGTARKVAVLFYKQLRHGRTALRELPITRSVTADAPSPISSEGQNRSAIPCSPRQRPAECFLGITQYVRTIRPSSCFKRRGPRSSFVLGLPVTASLASGSAGSTPRGDLRSSKNELLGPIKIGSTFRLMSESMPSILSSSR
jgi:hypothetical protein